MREVESTVCNNYWSGTDQHVRLFFKTIKKTPGKEDEVQDCRTEILDTGVVGVSKNDWATGEKQTWKYSPVWYGKVVEGKHNFLGACAKDLRPPRRRSVDQLWFKIEIVRPELNVDDVEICKLRVEFGDFNR